MSGGGRRGGRTGSGPRSCGRSSSSAGRRAGVAGRRRTRASRARCHVSAQPVRRFGAHPPTPAVRPGIVLHVPVLLVLVILLTSAAPAAATAWRWPLRGEVITPFRLAADRFAPGQHRGIDIAAAAGAAVRSACPRPRPVRRPPPGPRARGQRRVRPARGDLPRARDDRRPPRRGGRGRREDRNGRGLAPPARRPPHRPPERLPRPPHPPHRPRAPTARSTPRRDDPAARDPLGPPPAPHTTRATARAAPTPASSRSPHGSASPPPRRRAPRRGRPTSTPHGTRGGRGRVVRTAQVAAGAGGAVPIASADHGVLRHHADLLRQRGPASGARVHDDRGRRRRPASAAAGGGRVLPHGHRRAR